MWKKTYLKIQLLTVKLLHNFFKETVLTGRQFILEKFTWMSGQKMMYCFIFPSVKINISHILQRNCSYQRQILISFLNRFHQQFKSHALSNIHICFSEEYPWTFHNYNSLRLSFRFFFFSNNIFCNQKRKKEGV